MASTPFVSGGILVVAPGGFMPPRLLLAPAGTRLPAGVYAVAVAASAAPGSGRRGAVRGVAAGSEGGDLFLTPAGARVSATIFAVPEAAPGSGRRSATRSLAAAAGSNPGKTDDDDEFFRGFLKDQGNIALSLLSELTAPAAPRLGRYEELKLEVVNLVAKAEDGDKMGRAVSLVRAAYAIVRVAHWCYPSPEVGERDAVLIKGVLTAINTAASAARTARYIHGCGGGRA